jgi:hypothetical protein
VSASDIVLGFGITVILAVGCQIIAAKFRLPAIVLLLPAGFIAGHYITEVNPEKTLGPAHRSLGRRSSVRWRIDLIRGSRTAVRRLLLLGIPITFAGAAFLAWLFLGISRSAAIMLGAIVIVSGPTVVTPLLEAARARRRVSRILGWEGVTIDPFGAIIGAVLFQGLVQHVHLGHGAELLSFLRSIGIGLLGGVIGTAVLWLLLSKLNLSGVLAPRSRSWYRRPAPGATPTDCYYGIAANLVIDPPNFKTDGTSVHLFATVTTSSAPFGTNAGAHRRTALIRWWPPPQRCAGIIDTRARLIGWRILRLSPPTPAVPSLATGDIRC